MSSDGSTNTPVANHMIRKNTSFITLKSISPPFTVELTAIDESNTIITTANRSSTIRTANTSEANFLC